MDRSKIIPVLLFLSLFFPVMAVLVSLFFDRFFGIHLIIPVWPNKRMTFLMMFNWTCMLSLAIYIGVKANTWVGAFIGLSVLSGHYPFSTPYSQAALQCIMLGGIWYLICVELCGKKSNELILDIMCLFALANVLFIILQYFNLDMTSTPLKGTEQATEGLMSYKHGASAMLAICAPAFCRGWRQWGLIPIAIGLYVAKTFVGPLAVVIATTWLIFQYSERSYTRLVVLLLAITTLVAYATFVDVPDTSWRFRTWKVAIVETIKHPITGSGLNHFQFFFGNKSIANYTANKVQYHKYAHSEPVHMLFEMGYPFLILLMGYTVNIWRRYTPEVMIDVMIMLAVAIASMVGFPYHIGASAIIIVTRMALLERGLRDAKSNEYVISDHYTGYYSTGNRFHCGST